MIFENVQNPNAVFNFELAVSQLVIHPKYENMVTCFARELYGNPRGTATVMYITLRHPQNTGEWLPADAMQKLYSYPPHLGFCCEYWYTRGATEQGRAEDPALLENVGEALDSGLTLYAWAESEDLQDALLGNIDWVGNVQINGQARCFTVTMEWHCGETTRASGSESISLTPFQRLTVTTSTVNAGLFWDESELLFSM